MGELIDMQKEIAKIYIKRKNKTFSKMKSFFKEHGVPYEVWPIDKLSTAQLKEHFDYAVKDIEFINEIFAVTKAHNTPIAKKIIGKDYSLDAFRTLSEREFKIFLENDLIKTPLVVMDVGTEDRPFEISMWGMSCTLFPSFLQGSNRVSEIEYLLERNVPVTDEDKCDWVIKNFNPYSKLSDFYLPDCACLLRGSKLVWTELENGYNLNVTVGSCTKDHFYDSKISEDDLDILQNIRDKMTDLELSQARLAKIIGSNSVYVGAVLNGSTLKPHIKEKNDCLV